MWIWIRISWISIILPGSGSISKSYRTLVLILDGKKGKCLRNWDKVYIDGPFDLIVRIDKLCAVHFSKIGIEKLRPTLINTLLYKDRYLVKYIKRHRHILIFFHIKLMFIMFEFSFYFLHCERSWKNSARYTDILQTGYPNRVLNA